MSSPSVILTLPMSLALILTSSEALADQIYGMAKGQPLACELVSMV